MAMNHFYFNKIQECTLFVDESNSTALSLYQSLGFKTVSHDSLFKLLRSK